jgi:enoyl-CoA hydratase/carnithine racemase
MGGEGKGKVRLGLASAIISVAATKSIARDRTTFAEMVELSDQLVESAEAIEGMSAFFEKREPTWTMAK